MASPSADSVPEPTTPASEQQARITELQTQLLEAQQRCATLQKSLLTFFELKDLLLLVTSVYDDHDIELSDRIDQTLEQLKTIVDRSPPAYFDFVPEQMLKDLARPVKRVEIETVQMNLEMALEMEALERGVNATDQAEGSQTEKRKPEHQPKRPIEESRLPSTSSKKRRISDDPPEGNDTPARRSSRIAVRAAGDDELAHPGRRFLDLSETSTGGGHGKEFEDEEDYEGEDGYEKWAWHGPVYDEAGALSDAEGPELANPIRTRALYCPIFECEGQFEHRRQLDDHLWLKHQVRRYRCIAYDCGRTFDKKTNLESHTTSCHSEPDSGYWRCEECNYEAQDRPKLQTHYWISHESGHFVCEADGGRCEYVSFENRLDVMLHQRKDHRLLRFICLFKQCDKSFDKKVHLEAHERLHTGEKPFTCPDCGRGFNIRNNLIRHSFIHSDVKRFACKWEGCGHASTDMANIIRHVRTRHFLLPATIKKQREMGIMDERDPKLLIEKLKVNVTSKE